MQPTTLTLGHSPDPDDAFMFYALAKGLIPTHGFRFEHILQDIQTLNERATRGELDITAISLHAYAYVSERYALLPSGASMGDGYGPMLVAKQKFSRAEIAGKKIAVPGTMTSAFLALQLWLGKSAKEFNYVVVPFDQIFKTVRSGQADVGLIIHEGQLTYQNEGLVVCEDLGVWWGKENDGLPLPLGGNVIHKRFSPDVRKTIAGILAASIQFSLDHRAEAVQHALAIRARHGPRPRRQIRRHVRQPLDAGLRRAGPGIHPPVSGTGLRARADSAPAGTGICRLREETPVRNGNRFSNRAGDFSYRPEHVCNRVSGSRDKDCG